MLQTKIHDYLSCIVVVVDCNKSGYFRRFVIDLFVRYY